jgi:hypothetical protein
MKRLLRKILCALDFHEWGIWHPYEVVNPDCEIRRCIHCRYHEWR